MLYFYKYRFELGLIRSEDYDNIPPEPVNTILTREKNVFPLFAFVFAEFCTAVWPKLEDGLP